MPYWFHYGVLQQIVQYGNVLCIVLITLQNWNKFGCFCTAFLHTWRKIKKVYPVACISFRLCWKKVSSFYVCSICLRNMLLKLKRMKRNVKQKAGFRWKCVLKSMFILLFTRINNDQSSVVSKISIYLGTHVTIYLIHKVGRVFVFK